MLSEDNKEKIINFLTKQGIAILLAIGFLSFVAWQNVEYTNQRDQNIKDQSALIKDQQKTIQECALASSKLNEVMVQISDNMKALTLELNDLKREIRFKNKN